MRRWMGSYGAFMTASEFQKMSPASTTPNTASLTAMEYFPHSFGLFLSPPFPPPQQECIARADGLQGAHKLAFCSWKHFYDHTLYIQEH